MDGRSPRGAEPKQEGSTLKYENGDERRLQDPASQGQYPPAPPIDNTPRMAPYFDPPNRQQASDARANVLPVNERNEALESSSAAGYNFSPWSQPHSFPPQLEPGYSNRQQYPAPHTYYAPLQPLPQAATRRHLQAGLLQQAKPLAQLATKSVNEMLPQYLPLILSEALKQLRLDYPPEPFQELLQEALVAALPHSLEEALRQGLSRLLSQTTHLQGEDIFSQALPGAVESVLQELLQEALPNALEKALAQVQPRLISLLLPETLPEQQHESSLLQASDSTRSLAANPPKIEEQATSKHPSTLQADQTASRKRKADVKTEQDATAQEEAPAKARRTSKRLESRREGSDAAGADAHIKREA